MMGFERSDDYQPLMWVRGHPVHATLMLVVLHSLALIVCCVLPAFGVLPPINSQQYLDLLGFSTEAAWHHGALWQFFTYGFCHYPSPWFLLDMFFLYMWGREVERYFGRKTFLLLYAGLWAAGPILLSAYSAVSKTNEHVADSLFVDFGVFIAFVTIYPNVQFFFGLLAKWIAVAMLGIWTLRDLAPDLVGQRVGGVFRDALCQRRRRFQHVGNHSRTASATHRAQRGQAAHEAAARLGYALGDARRRA
jgi:membrane associated rhomboid family serine protease